MSGDEDNGASTQKRGDGVLRFSREITLGNVISMIGFAAMFVSSLLLAEQRMSKQEAAIASLQEADHRTAADVRDIKVDIIQRLDRMEAKVERIAERQVIGTTTR